MPAKKPISQLERALGYARRGWPVLKIHGTRDGACNCSKGTACTSAGKHPATKNGVKDATTDAKTIRKWFENDPHANIGMATGTASGLVVFDIDPRNGGNKTLAAAKLKIGPLMCTMTARTGGGGRHLFFRHPGVPIKKDTAGKKVGLGVDIMSDGGFVVMPGSRHVSGRAYIWKKDRGPVKRKIAALPEAWVHRLAGAHLLAPTVWTPAPNLAEAINEGARNTTLCARAGALHRAGLAAGDILAALSGINAQLCRPPLDENEVRQIVESVMRYPTPAGATTTGDPAQDLMNETLETHYAGGQHILLGSDGRFWTYDGRCWSMAAAELVKNRILATIDARESRTGPSRAFLIRQVVDLMRAKLASPNDKLRIAEEPPPVINCRNGEIWIGADGTVELRPHRAESYLRHCLDVDYDPKALCPRYDGALAAIFQRATDSADLVRHWHEIAGYMIQPRRKTPLILILQGGGSNGKTMLMNVVVRLLGSDLTSHQPIESLERSRFAIASLFGKLLLIDDDVRAGVRLPDGELKKISEAKRMTGERKFGQPFNFICLALPVLLCNNISTVADLGHGMQRRLMVVPFERTFSPAEQDPNLFEAIGSAEMSGVLNRCLAGLQRVIGRGFHFQAPDAVKAAIKDWMRHANPLPNFLEERCERVEKGWELASNVYGAYREFASEMGITLVQQRQTFHRNLESLGFTLKKGGRGQKIIGLKLKPRI